MIMFHKARLLFTKTSYAIEPIQKRKDNDCQILKALLRKNTRSRAFATSSFRLDDFYDSTLERYIAKPVVPITLKELLKWGESPVTEEKLIRSAQYVSQELPKRLARR